jgi:hypothetical protein
MEQNLTVRTLGLSCPERGPFVKKKKKRESDGGICFSIKFYVWWRVRRDRDRYENSQRGEKATFSFSVLGLGGWVGWGGGWLGVSLG